MKPEMRTVSVRIDSPFCSMCRLQTATSHNRAVFSKSAIRSKITYVAVLCNNFSQLQQKILGFPTLFFFDWKAPEFFWPCLLHSRMTPITYSYTWYIHSFMRIYVHMLTYPVTPSRAEAIGSVHFPFSINFFTQVIDLRRSCMLHFSTKAIFSKPGQLVRVSQFRE